VLDLTVIENVRVCDEHHRLKMACSHPLTARPGQFVQLRCRRRAGTNSSGISQETGDNRKDDPTDRLWSEGPVLLPRPFSLAGLQRVEGQTYLEVLLRIVGRGTAWLASLRSGDGITALGPLGNGFTLPTRPTRTYLVGGGCGLPPLIWLAESLRNAGCDVVAFCGARSAPSLPLTRTGDPSTDPTEPRMVASEFSASRTPVVLTTDDGSLGVRGLVSDAVRAYHSAHRFPPDELMVYTCGPEAMMRSVAEWCTVQEIPCQVCMERLMACGIGTCQSCVVPVRRDPSSPGFVYKLCCKDGPVFDARDIIWASRS